MSHAPVIGNTDDACENLSLSSAASCASLDHLDGNGGPDSLSQESYGDMPLYCTPFILIFYVQRF